MISIATRLELTIPTSLCVRGWIIIRMQYRGSEVGIVNTIPTSLLCNIAVVLECGDGWLLDSLVTEKGVK